MVGGGREGVPGDVVVGLLLLFRELKEEAMMMRDGGTGNAGFAYKLMAWHLYLGNNSVTLITTYLGR